MGGTDSGLCGCPTPETGQCSSTGCSTGAKIDNINGTWYCQGQCGGTDSTNPCFPPNGPQCGDTGGCDIGDIKNNHDGTHSCVVGSQTVCCPKDGKCSDVGCEVGTKQDINATQWKCIGLCKGKNSGTCGGDPPCNNVSDGECGPADPSNPSCDAGTIELNNPANGTWICKGTDSSTITGCKGKDSGTCGCDTSNNCCGQTNPPNTNCKGVVQPEPVCGSYHDTTKCTEGTEFNLSETNKIASWSCKNTDGKTVDCPPHDKCDCGTCSPPPGTCIPTPSPQCVSPSDCDTCRGGGSSSCCSDGVFRPHPTDTLTENKWTCKISLNDNSGNVGCSCTRTTIPAAQCVTPTNCDDCRGNGSTSCCSPGEFRGHPLDTDAQNKWTCINNSGGIECNCTRPPTPTTQPPQSQCPSGQYDDKSTCESNMPEEELCEQVSNGCWRRLSVCGNQVARCTNSLYFHNGLHDTDGDCVRYHANECVNGDVLCEPVGPVSGYDTLCHEFWDCSEGRITD